MNAISNTSVSFEKCDSLDKKRTVMEACDASFTISVVNGYDFENLLNKIHSYAEFIVVRMSEKPVGYAAIYANDKVSKVGYITLFAIRQEYQHMGIGRKLIERCKEVSLNNGMQSIKLEVLREDEGQQTFYKKQGFSVTNEKTGRNSIYMVMML